MLVCVRVYCLTKNNVRYKASNINDFLCDHTQLEFEESASTTFDTIFYKCANVCGITPLYIPLFAFQDNKSNWIKLGSRLDSHFQQNASSQKIDIEFRIRFTFKSECSVDGAQCQAHRYSPHDDSSKSVMNDKVIEYLFHQRRSDFLKGKLPMKESINDKIGSVLGVAVLNILCLACEMNCDIWTVHRRLRNYRKLLPADSRNNLQAMHFFNRFRVTMKFRHYLRHFAPNCNRWLDSGWSVAYFHCKYLRNLELLVGLDETETYNLAQSESSDYDKITIGADCGIVVHRAHSNSADGEQWCDFDEVTDMSMQIQSTDMQTLWMISISKLNGKILSLSLPSLENAENIVSVIDGYYRLLTDAHHYLSEDICSPAVVEQFNNFCHGPISCAFAESRIRSLPELQVGDCLLRQSQESHDEYFINTVIEDFPSIVIRNYKLDRVDGKLGIYGDPPSHIHNTLSSLLDSCRDGFHNGVPVPFHVDRLIHPSSKHQSILIVYRCTDTHRVQRDGLLNNANSIPPSTAIIMQRDYCYERLLGAGKFTSVMLHSNKNHRDNKVVLKYVHFDPKERFELGKKQHVEESFQESMYMLHFLKNDHIVQQIGTMKNMMVLEYVPRGSITDYLHNASANNEPRPQGWSSWFLYVLWQLTHACNYLEEKNCPHGNICGKNVLLWHDLPQPLVKLADSGVRTCSKTVNRQYIAEPVLPAPWLAQEFCVMNNQANPPMITCTINGDKWSYATTVCEICNWGQLPNSVEISGPYNLPHSMKQKYNSGQVMDIPNTLRDNSAHEVTSLIRECWSCYPPKRPEFKKILRELGTVLASDYVLPSVQPPKPGPNPDPDIAPMPDLPTYEDERLIFVKQLGEGHFGHVDLYTYDRYGGRAEQVAVKSLRRTTNNRENRHEFNNEIETMRKLNHMYVVKLLGVAEPSLRIVMEYLPCGNLPNYLQLQKNNNVALPSLYKTLLQFSSQISQGMLALQEKRLVHRDLALRNILLARKTHFDPYFVKISDFGLSRTLRDDKNYYLGNPDEFPAQWYAPECLRNDHGPTFHFESDVWSFGVTVWEMFSYGNRPKYEALPNISVRNLPELQDLLKNGGRLPQPPECPTHVFNLIKKCWVYEPKERIKFDELRRSFDELSSRY